MASQSKINRQIGAAILGAVAFIVMFFHFPIIPFVPYLKIDFSDTILLLSGLLYGPQAVLMTGFIRSALHYIQTGGDLGYPIGVTASFIASISLLLPVLQATKTELSVKNFVKGSIFGIIILTIVMVILNWFVLTPIYFKLFNLQIESLKELIVYGIVPFNMIKGVLVSIVNLLVYLKVYPFLRKRLKVKPTCTTTKLK
ncbi:ECF transporter S component [Atopobacter phocae]|uniref:ECF transporter S component n=1 Tax=Atopobacter phocae TaxID=136492 RepID=UPI000470AC0A|nr:ECF transporter S component [Atopobacter phocae]